MTRRHAQSQTRSTSTLTALICAVLAMSACATDDDEQGGAGTADAAAVKGECPRMADSCPAECDPVNGDPVHETPGEPGACVEFASVVIGCIPRPFGILTFDTGCVKRAADGQKFSIYSSSAYARWLLEDPRWVECPGPGLYPECESP